jgi:L-alanine-DL-glutamate epimerase-like enolase superfamily enzyme
MMRITGYRLGILRVPLRTPFKTALRTVEMIEDVVLQLETDTGCFGHGEAPPTVAITGDSLDSILSGLREAILPALLGRNIADIEGNCRTVQNALHGNTRAKAAAEIALYDLHAQAAGLPLYQALGGGTPRLGTDITISVNDTQTMLTDCEAALARGFTALKIKVGKDLDGDYQRLRAIRDAVAGRAQLRIDANQGWTAAHTLAVLGRLEAEAGAFDLIEQPVPAADFDGMREIKAAGLLTPLMADESAFSLPQVANLLAHDAADIINIKLMKTGGLSQALAITELCRQQQVPCLMGCMLEGAISATAAAHLAAANADVITRIDLDGPGLAAFNPVDANVDFNDSVITLGERPGLGIVSISHTTWLT